MKGFCHHCCLPSARFCATSRSPGPLDCFGILCCKLLMSVHSNVCKSSRIRPVASSPFGTPQQTFVANILDKVSKPYPIKIAKVRRESLSHLTLASIDRIVFDHSGRGTLAVLSDVTTSERRNGWITLNIMLLLRLAHSSDDTGTHRFPGGPAHRAFCGDSERGHLRSVPLLSHILGTQVLWISGGGRI